MENPWDAFPSTSVALRVRILGVTAAAIIEKQWFRLMLGPGFWRVPVAIASPLSAG